MNYFVLETNRHRVSYNFHNLKGLRHDLAFNLPIKAKIEGGNLNLHAQQQHHSQVIDMATYLILNFYKSFL